MGVGQAAVPVVDPRGPVLKRRQRDARAAQRRPRPVRPDALTLAPALNVYAFDRVRSSRRANTSSKAFRPFVQGRCAAAPSNAGLANFAFHRSENVSASAGDVANFLTYCLQITLTRRLHGLAPGVTARSALTKFAAVQMIDVHLPTTDGREIILTRCTEPEPELRLLIDRMKLDLPAQPPPKIAAAALKAQHAPSEDLFGQNIDFLDARSRKTAQSAKTG